MKIYIGNLSSCASEAEVHELFARYGTVHSCKLTIDRHTGKCKGFGFVEMEDVNAKTAISVLDGFDFGGQTLRVEAVSGC